MLAQIKSYIEAQTKAASEMAVKLRAITDDQHGSNEHIALEDQWNMVLNELSEIQELVNKSIDEMVNEH